MPVNNNLENPLVTVFVPAYNEEKLLAETLERLKNQDYDGEYELMVIDNASTDRTAGIARKAGARLINEPAKGNRFAVERGFKEAKGEIVVQTDADSRPGREFLRKIMAPYADPKVVGCGTRIEFLGVSPVFNNLYKLAAILNPREAMWGPSLSARKWAWKKIGGFNKGFDINSDGYFTLQLRKIGKVAIVKDYYLPVSGRRYQGNFLKVIRRPYKDIR